MTIASLVVDILANTVQLNTGVDQANRKLSDMERQAEQLGAALGSMFTLSKIIAFGNEVLEAGDKIQKMSDQTGLGTDEVQKLGYIAGQSGSSIESLIGAVQNLQQRIGDDSTGAAGAFAKLGINAEEFNKLGTYQQMTTLGEAIKDIHDPTEQASVAAALFGKTWKEILPAIKSGMEEVGEQAPVMADSTVKALDRIGDTMKAAHQNVIAWGGGFITAIEGAGFAVGDFLSHFDPAHFGQSNTELLKMLGTLNDSDGLKGALAKIKQPLLDVGAGVVALGSSAKATAEAQISLTASAKESIEIHKKQAEELKRLEAAHEKFRASIEGLSFKKYVQEGIPMVGLVSGLSDYSSRLGDHVDDLSSSFNEFHGGLTIAGNEISTVTIPMFSALATGVLPKMTKAIDQAKTSTETFGQSMMKTLQNVPQMVASAFTGGGGLMGAVQGIGSQVASNLGEKLGKGISSLGSMGGPIGAAIGSLAGPIIGFFTNVFSGGAEHLINPVREAFVQLNGGLGALNEKAHAAGMTLDAMLNARNPEAYKKAIDDLNAAFKFQDDAMKTLDDTVKKYGFSIDELGPKFSQQKLSEGFLQLYQDTKVLTAAGIDYDTVIAKQADSYEALIVAALKTGGTIPSALEPVLQRMAEMGLLTDENGVKMDDLSKLTFAETLDAKFSTLIDTINKLADAISRGLGTAISGLPNEKTINIGYTYDAINVPTMDDTNYAARGGFVTSRGISYFGSGGAARGFDTVPAMLQAGERVLNVNDTKAFDGAGGMRALGGSRIDVSKLVAEQQRTQQEIAGLRADMARRDRAQPKLIRDAIALAA